MSILFVQCNASAILAIVDDELVRADSKGKTGVLKRLEKVKTILTTDYNILCGMTALASICGDLQVAIKESQSNELSVDGISLIEDAYFTLDRALVISSAALDMSPEMKGNEEYIKARELVAKMLAEGRY